MTRYVVVSADPGDTTILRGPVEWDGAAPYAPPSGTVLMLEAAALAAGYTVPPHPQAQVTETTIRERAESALAANGTYLALASPTNAQVVAQVGRLTRECSALIRLPLRRLDTDDGT